MSDPSPPDALDPIPVEPIPAPPRWDWQPKLRWFAAEILIVVVGVLIALALNAWWAERQRAADERALIAELREDVVETRRDIERLIGWHQDIARGARALLTGLSDGVVGVERDTLLLTLGSVLGSAASWQPTHDTYFEAVGSGRLALITNPTIRSALSHYHVQSERMETLADFVTTRYHEHDEPFLLSHTIYSEVGYRRGEDAEGLYPPAPHRTDFEALAANPELWNLLSIKLLVATGSVDELAAFDSLSVDLLGILHP